MDTKLHAVRSMEVKALDEEARTFEGLASTWDRDLGDDVIMQGAFRKTLREWRQSGKVLPLLDSHNWFSVRDAVGKLIDAKETDDGLWTKWRIVPGADGDEVLARLRDDGDGPFVDSMSIGYRAVKWHMEDDDEGRETRVLKEIDLHEVSLVLFPMNPAARIDAASVKDLVTAEVTGMLERCRPELRSKVKAALTSALTAPPPEDPPVAPAEAESKDGPDLRAFDQLRLRRLASLSSHPGGTRNG